MNNDCFEFGEKEYTNISSIEKDKKLFSRPVLIGVSGGSASGKTTVSSAIFKMIGIQDCVLISMDSYYKDLTYIQIYNISEEEYTSLSEYNYDHPDAYDFDLILEHLASILDGKEIQVPVYNFTTSKRENYFQAVKPNNLIIFEGILALYDKVYIYVYISFRE